MTAPSTGTLLRALHQSLTAAGDIIRRAAARPIAVHHKGRIDIVTPTDRAVERRIVGIIRRYFPDHGFLMEESGARVSASRYRWVIDPIDGTVNFAHGVPVCAASVGLEKDGKVILGGVYNPFSEEKFIGVKGKGARLNGKRISVSPRSKLVDSLVATGFPYDRYKNPQFYLSYVGKVLKHVQGLRRLGASSLDTCYVAAGRYEAYWEFKIKPWDVAGALVVLEESGGKVTNFRGEPYSLADTSETLATNGHVHAAMLRILKHRPSAKG